MSEWLGGVRELPHPTPTHHSSRRLMSEECKDFVGGRV